MTGRTMINYWSFTLLLVHKVYYIDNQNILVRIFTTSILLFLYLIYLFNTVLCLIKIIQILLWEDLNFFLHYVDILVRNKRSQ